MKNTYINLGLVLSFFLIPSTLSAQSLTDRKIAKDFKVGEIYYKNTLASGNQTGYMKDREGNVYTVASFGNAGWWMTQNLNSTRYDNGSPLDALSSLQANNNEHYYCYPSAQDNNNGLTHLELNPDWDANLGLLYNWYAAINMGTGGGQTPDPGQIDEENAEFSPHRQGICPKGWHVPSNKECLELKAVISANYPNYSTLKNTTDPNKCGAAIKSPIRLGGQATPKETNSTNPTSYSLSPARGGFNLSLLGSSIKEESVDWGLQGSFWTSSRSVTTDQEHGTSWKAFTKYDQEEFSTQAQNFHYEYQTVRCKQN